MRRATIYDASTGLFVSEIAADCSERDWRQILEQPAGLKAIEGRYDRHTQRVDVATGQVVAYQRPAAEIEGEQRAEQDRVARRRIAELERQQARPMRELAIDPNNAEAKRRLAEIDGEIAGLRTQLQAAKEPSDRESP